MKKEILEALTTKFQGVSSAVLDRIANKLAKTITKTEDIATAVEGVTIQQIIDSYTDSRVTEASETARKNAVNDYESKYGLKDGVKTVDNNSQETQGANVDATQQLMQQLMQRIATLESAKATESRKQQLDAVISRLPEPLRKPYSRIALDTMKDEEFTAMLGEITADVETIAKESSAKGGVFGQPKAPFNVVNKTELTDAQKAAISHRSGAVQTDAQPF